MSLYQRLQAKAAHFVLGTAQIKEKQYYEIIANSQNTKEQPDNSNDDARYLFNIGTAGDKENQETKWYMQIFLMFRFITRHLVSLFSWDSTEEANTEEETWVENVSNSIYEAISNGNLDPEKVILNHTNAEQIRDILANINDKLCGSGKYPINHKHETYQFEKIPVYKYVDKPENDDVVLDTVFVKPQETSGKYIINCTASGRTYLDWIGDMKRDADATKATVVGFSYRSIGLSSGQLFTQQNIIDDIVAQVKYLIHEKHIQPQDINLYGLCMGGTFATMAAAQLQDEGIPVKLYISRSYKRYDQAAFDLLMPSKYDSWPIYIGKILFLPITFPFGLLFKAYFWILGWQVNMVDALEKIDPDNIEYDFAEPSESDAKLGYTGDKMVLKSNSPYDILQSKLAESAKKRAENLVEKEQDPKMKAYMRCGVNWAFGQGLSNWSEEDALSLLLQLESTIKDLEIKAQHEKTSTQTSDSLQTEITKLKAVQKGLCFARVCCQLAHQVVRNNPDERSWNPHASPAEKLRAYGFEGNLRSRLSWFINSTSNQAAPASEIPSMPTALGANN